MKKFDRFLSNNGCLKWNILTKRYNIDLKSFDKNLSYIIFNIKKNKTFKL